MNNNIFANQKKNLIKDTKISPEINEKSLGINRKGIFTRDLGILKKINLQYLKKLRERPNRYNDYSLNDKDFNIITQLSRYLEKDIFGVTKFSSFFFDLLAFQVYTGLLILEYISSFTSTELMEAVNSFTNRKFDFSANDLNYYFCECCLFGNIDKIIIFLDKLIPESGIIKLIKF